MCKIRNFCDQICAQKDCPHMTQDNAERQHTMDISWLHKLSGIYLKWAKKVESKLYEKSWKLYRYNEMVVSNLNFQMLLD